MSRSPDLRVSNPLRALSGAWAEIALLLLLAATALIVAFQHHLLDRTIHLTPANIGDKVVQIIDDRSDGGHSTVTELGPLHWRCDLKTGIDYPYCAHEMFFDKDMGTHGLDLTHMHEMRITMLYKGPASSYRIYFKNFNPLYAVRPDDSSPKSLRVEPVTAPGKVEVAELILADFAVPD